MTFFRRGGSPLESLVNLQQLISYTVFGIPPSAPIFFSKLLFLPALLLDQPVSVLPQTLLMLIHS
jgi:hypothetical protein